MVQQFNLFKSGCAITSKYQSFMKYFSPQLALFQGRIKVPKSWILSLTAKSALSHKIAFCCGFFCVKSDLHKLFALFIILKSYRTKLDAGV